MAQVTARAVQDEPIDGLAWRLFGSTAGVEKILEANPGLAEIAEALPAGSIVNIPQAARATPATVDLVQLWD